MILLGVACGISRTLLLEITVDIVPYETLKIEKLQFSIRYAA